MEDKQVYKMDEGEEMDEMHKVLPNIKEEDFVELPDYGNTLCVNAEDFPDLEDERKGSDVMFLVRGVIRSNDTKNGNDISYPHDNGKDKIEILMFDAALVHGKKSMRTGGGGKFQAMTKAIEAKGHSEESAKAIAASAGRKKYGKQKFQNMASAGLRRYYKGNK